MSDRPRVSVIIPTYNRARLLERSIDSVRAQTLQDWELLLVDDGSTDDTAGLAARLTSADRRIRYLSNDRTRGSAGARNCGIRKAQGEFIAFLDSDDTWFPPHLERALEYLAGHPEVSLVGCDQWRINHSKGERKTASGYLLELIDIWLEDPIAQRLFDRDEIRNDLQKIARRDLIVNFLIAGYLWLQPSTAVLRREILDEVGIFDEDRQRTTDFDLWLRINNRSRIGFVPEPMGEVDITGIDSMDDDRYGLYERDRLLSEIKMHTYMLSLLQRFSSSARMRRYGYGDGLSRDQMLYLRRSMRSLHRRIARLSQRSNWSQAALHYLRGARYRPKDFIYFLTKPRHFLTHPWS